MFRTAQTGSSNRNLLPVHHTIAVLFSPAVGATLRVLLMTLPRQVPHFFLHHQVHQSQSRLARQLAEPLHRALLIDLVSSLHSDSLLFPWRKNYPRPIMTGV